MLTANEPRIKACAVMSVCHEPGCHTIFQEASPTFKKRFMYMSGIIDEDEFDEFRKTITWQGHAEKIRVPYLCVAGEAEELSPLEHSERADGGAARDPSRWWCIRNCGIRLATFRPPISGRSRPILVADWLADRLAGKPFDQRALVRHRLRRDQQDSVLTCHSGAREARARNPYSLTCDYGFRIDAPRHPE